MDETQPSTPGRGVPAAGLRRSPTARRAGGSAWTDERTPLEGTWGGWRGLVRYLAVSVVATFVCLLLSVGLLVPWEGSPPILGLYVELFDALTHEPEPWLWLGLLTVVIVVPQAIFLLPVVRPPRVAKRPRSLLKSVVMVSFAAALIVACLAWGSLELLTPGEAVETFDVVVWKPFITVPLAVLLPGWCLWGRFLWRRSHAYDPVAIDRLMAPLLRSTAIGLGLLFPIDLYVRHKKDCFCATSSAWGLALSLAALLWQLGPFVLLLATRKQRQRLRRQICLTCGYARIPGTDRCPECGRGWTKRRRAALARPNG